MAPKHSHQVPEYIRAEVLQRGMYTCAVRLSRCVTNATDVEYTGSGETYTVENLRAVCVVCAGMRLNEERSDKQPVVHRRRRRPAERHPGMAT